MEKQAEIDDIGSVRELTDDELQKLGYTDANVPEHKIHYIGPSLREQVEYERLHPRYPPARPPTVSKPINFQSVGKYGKAYARPNPDAKQVAGPPPNPNARPIVALPPPPPRPNAKPPGDSGYGTTAPIRVPTPDGGRQRQHQSGGVGPGEPHNWPGNYQNSSASQSPTPPAGHHGHAVPKRAHTYTYGHGHGPRLLPSPPLTRSQTFSHTPPPHPSSSGPNRQKPIVAPRGPLPYPEDGVERKPQNHNGLLSRPPVFIKGTRSQPFSHSPPPPHPPSSGPTRRRPIVNPKGPLPYPEDDMERKPQKHNDLMSRSPVFIKGYHDQPPASKRKKFSWGNLFGNKSSRGRRRRDHGAGNMQMGNNVGRSRRY